MTRAQAAATAGLALLVLARPLPARAGTELGSFPSPSLGRDVAFTVQLPPSYAEGARRYPVVYVLHGLFEGNGFWERRGLASLVTQLWASGELPEMLVVAVDGGNSFFVNAPGGRYEDLVTRDVVAAIESRYRVVPGRQGRALLGISMGGYAALRIALAHPQAFPAVAAHSAMLLEKVPTREEGAGRGQVAALHRVFGDPIDAELWTRSNPLLLAQQADPRRTPALYFDCGSEDRYGLANGNRELHARLEARGVPHDFALHPGDHGYEYVRSVLPQSLRFLASALQKAGSKAAVR
jgi:S-formylglutathione hydrolase FrmB